MTSELEDKFQTLHEIVRAARMNIINALRSE